MSPQEFAALDAWIKAEAKVVVAERTYKNDRAIGEVMAKAGQRRMEAYRALVGAAQ